MECKEALRKIRKAHNYSQNDIARILKTTQQQYSKYENGIQAIPVLQIIALADFYGVTTDELLGIKTFMTTEEDSKKFIKLANETVSLIRWAEEQTHITEDEADLLLTNFERIKDEIERSDNY